MAETPHPGPLPAGRGEGTLTRLSPRAGRGDENCRWSFGSGPEVARLFARGLALVSLVAWLSLGGQVHVLIGSRGLLPGADFIEAARAAAGRVASSTCRRSAWWFHSDGALTAGIVLGVALSLGALFGVARRALLRAVDAAVSVLRRGDARLPVVPVGQPAARVRLARRVPAHRRGRRPSRTSCSGWCCSSSTSSRASPSGSRRSTTGRTAAR